MGTRLNITLYVQYIACLVLNFNSQDNYCSNNRQFII